MTIDKTLNKHDSCPVVIIERWHLNKPNPIPGLYCATHGKLIKWLNREHSDELETLGVENLGFIKGEGAAKTQYEPRRSSWI
jgi:hypothetical protein